MNSELQRCHQLIHLGGCHIVSGKNSQNLCYICKQSCATNLSAIANRKRHIALDAEYGWEEKDDLHITWGNTNIFFVIVSQTVSGTASEKIMQHLTYEKDGLYPGILVLVTNDDNVFCERQFQYFKRRGGKNVFFVWESRVKQFIRKVEQCHRANLDFKETRNILTVHRKKLMTTRLDLQQFKLLAKCRAMQKLEKKGVSMQEMKEHDGEISKNVEVAMKRLEQVWEGRCSE